MIGAEARALRISFLSSPCSLSCFSLEHLHLSLFSDTHIRCIQPKYALKLHVEGCKITIDYPHNLCLQKAVEIASPSASESISQQQSQIALKLIQYCMLVEYKSRTKVSAIPVSELSSYWLYTTKKVSTVKSCLFLSFPPPCLLLPLPHLTFS